MIRVVSIWPANFRLGVESLDFVLSKRFRSGGHGDTVHFVLMRGRFF